MTTPLAFRRMILRASLLGVLGLCINILTHSLAPQQPLALGTILLFISARSFGIVGGTITALIAELPANLFGGGDPFLLLRTVTLMGTLGFAAKQFPLVQAGIPLAIYWVLIMLPFYLFAVGDFSAAPLIFLCASDLLFLSLSSLLLSSSVVWEKLTQQLRHLPLTLFLPECIFTFVGLFTALALLAPLGTVHLYTILAQTLGLSAMIPLSIIAVAPSFFGSALTRILAQDYHSALQGGILQHGKKLSFSGLAAAYWRQKSAEETANDLLTRQTIIPASSKTELEPSVPGFIAPTQGVMALNRNGTITFVNRKMKSFGEISSNDIIGRTIDSLGMNQQFRKEILALVESTCEYGPRVTEFRLTSDDETKSRFFELSSQRSSALENSSLYDGPDSVVITAKDITGRRTVESHLLQAKKLESLGSMMTGIANSFNDALTSITQHAQNAKESNSDDIRTRALDRILDSAITAGQTVRQLLDFAQGSSPLEMKCDLVEIIKERLEFLQNSIGEAYALHFVSSVRTLPIRCNVNLIVQALLNLILNSKESYGGSPGTITVSLDMEEIPEEASHMQPGVRPGQFARLRIKDEGSGMSPETLSKAFDPFFTTKNSSGHSGLGLSIVFAVTRSHDGFLTAESHVEKGTTISLYFPILIE